MKYINGGICAAEGFKAGGIHMGVKTHNKNKKDVAMIVSDVQCTAAAVYTKNKVKASHITTDIAHLSDGTARAAVINSGIANACAPHGDEYALRMCAAAAKEIGCETDDIVIASTGVIGQPLNISAIENGMPELYKSISRSDAGSDAAAKAIMTTDTVKKELALETSVGGKRVKIGGIAKGSGMIHPNMGTMLCFLTTDCAISAGMIKEALNETVKVTFNRISVDGDTSTNDTCCVMANGKAGNDIITEKNEAYSEFVSALKELCTRISMEMASDGEGAKHLIICKVKNASDEETAQTVSKSVISSTLTKAAIFGSDANWGRVLCAMGYSGADFDPGKVSIAFESSAGSIPVCENGEGLDFDEELAKKILTEHDITIDIDMKAGSAECTCFGCDITYDYIKINGDYRT